MFGKNIGKLKLFTVTIQIVFNIFFDSIKIPLTLSRKVRSMANLSHDKKPSVVFEKIILLMIDSFASESIITPC